MTTAPTHTDAADDPRVDIQTRLQAASAYNRWIVDEAGPFLGRRVLDAGAGAGNLSELLLDRDQVVAVDEWPEFVAMMAERFAGRDNVAVHHGDLADPALVDMVRPYGIDSVICSNVLEHVDDDRQALLNFANLLPAGGRVFLLVPALPALYGAMDAADHHFRRYTKRSMRARVEGLPLEIEDTWYMNSPGVASWFLYGRVLRRSAVTEDMYSAYDRIIPWLSRLEGLVRPPLGQSLVTILRKPA
jgi:SAM-dependent methyltransferase